MKVLNDISEKIVLLRSNFLGYAKGYISKEKKINIHINKLQYRLAVTQDEDEKSLILETIELLTNEQLGNKQLLGEVNSRIQEVNDILQLTKEIDIEGIDSSLGIKLLEVQEEERKRIARELHDSTVQNLTSLIYKAELCSKVLENDQTRVRLELQIMIVSLKSIIEEMRNTIYDLRPSIAEDTNINSYMEKYIDNLSISYPSTVFKYEVHGTSHSIKPIYCLTLLRIAQEACQNSIKHANAKKIAIEVNYYKDSIKMIITDNGQGFNELNYNDIMGQRGHFGVSIMKERAQLLGGVVNISSKENKGTVVSVVVSKVYCDEGDENGSY